MKRAMPMLFALAGLLLMACGPTITPRPTPESRTVVDVDESPTATPAPADTAVPMIPTDTPSPEPSLMPTFTPTTVSKMEPTPTLDIRRGVVHEIRSIEEISASGLPQIVDITDSDAVLVFESSIPLACSVVYGKTTDYGRVALDLDMDAGVHTDHHPLLLGLEPDNEYHYRV